MAFANLVIDFDADAYLLSLTNSLSTDAAELISLINAAADSPNSHESTAQLALSLGLNDGVSG